MKSIMEEASSICKAIESAWARAGKPQEFSVKILEHPQTSFFGLKTAKSAKIAFFFTEVIAPKQKEYSARPPQQARTPQARPLPSSRPNDRGERTEPRAGQQPRRQPQHSAERPERYATGQQPAENRPARPEQPRQPHPRPERPAHSERPEQPPRQPHTPSARPERVERPMTERPQPSYANSNAPRETWAPEMVDAAHDWVKETLVMMGKPEIGVSTQISHNYLKMSLDKAVLDDPRQEETQLKSWGSLAMEAVREKNQKPLRSLRIILESKK